MASYILLELDTKAPAIEIYAPQYTTREITNVITVQSDEPLSPFQDFYFIDSANNRHDFTFYLEEEDKYVGIVKLSNVPVGLVTFYASVKDTVNNRSNIESVVLNVIEDSKLLKLSTSHSAAGMTSNTNSMKALNKMKTRKVAATTRGTDVDSKKYTRKIDTDTN